MGTSSGRRALWGPALLLLGCLLCVDVADAGAAIRRASSFVTPTRGSSKSLTLTSYLTDAADVHFAAVLSGHPPLAAGTIKAAATAMATTTDPSEHSSIVHAETVAVRSARKLDARLDGLQPNTSYDVYLVAEVPNSNGVFGQVLSVLDSKTFAAPPTVTAVSAAARGGSTSEAEINVTLSAPGVVHVALVPPSSGFSEDPQVEILAPTDLVGPWPVTRAHWVVITGQSRSWELLTLPLTAPGLRSASKYDVQILTEADGGGEVFGPLLHQPQALRTHAPAPEVTSGLCVAVNASASELSISYQLTFNAGDLGRVGPDTLDAFTYELRYTAETIPPAKSDHGGDQGRREGVLRTVGGFASVDELVAFSRERHVGVIRDLHAGTAYDIVLVAETHESHGVVSRESVITGCSTHQVAPKFITAHVTPTNGSVDALTLTVELERPGAVHYLVVPRTHHALRHNFQQAANVSHLRGILSDGGHNTSEMRSGTFTMESAAPTGEFLSSFTITGLHDDTTYMVVLFPETLHSHGVLGKPYASVIEATTHQRASEVTVVSILPKTGSTTRLQVQVLMSKPADTLFACVRRSASASEVDECYAIDEGALAKMPRNAQEFHFDLVNLTADSVYHVEFFAESAKQSDVRSLRTPVRQAKTHRTPPQLIESTASPVSARTDAVNVVSGLDEPGIIHYVAQEVTRATTSASAECWAAADIVTQGHRGVAGHEPRSGKILAAARRETFLLTGLAANSTYRIHLVSETSPHEETPSGVFGNSTCVDVVTHAPAPVIIKATAGAAARRTDSIVLTANLSAPGIVHYHVTDVDFADPAVIKHVPDAVERIRHPQVFRGSFLVTEDHLVLEVINGTNDTKPMEPLNFASHTTISGLDPATTYHVSLTTETPESDGVFGAFPPPIIVTTHATPPSFDALNVQPTPGSSSSISISFQLDQLGDVHYALFFRGLREDRSTEVRLVEEPQSESNATHANSTQWPPVASAYDLELLTPEALKEATVDELGEGVWENGTITVSREDAYKGKHVEKKFDKLPPGAVFDVCLVTETAASEGVFQWLSGPSACHRVATHADYSNQSLLFDHVDIRPVDGRTDAVHIRLAISKLLEAAPWDGVSKVARSPIEVLERACGRVPYFLLLDGHHGRPEFSHNSFAHAPRGDRTALKTAIPGRDHVVAAGALTNVTDENATYLVVERTIEHLDANTRYLFFFAEETVGSHGVFTTVNAHKGLAPSGIDVGDATNTHDAAALEVTTHEAAPRLTRYAATPTFGNTSRITISFNVACASCQLAIVHVLVLPDSCPEPPMDALRVLLLSNATTATSLACDAPPVHSRITVAMPERQHHKENVEVDIADQLEPNATYAVYLATETAHSHGVISQRPAKTTVTTSALAPRFRFLELRPRRGSTTELLLEFELDRPGAVHFMLGKADNAEFNVSSPYNISNKARPGQHRPQHHDYGRDVVRLRRSFAAPRAHARYVEVLDYLTAGTAYDAFAVAEGSEDVGVYGAVQALEGVATFANAPMLLAHSAFPTPGETHGLTVGFRVNDAGAVHLMATTTTHWPRTRHVAGGSRVHGNRLAAEDAFASHASVVVNRSELQAVGATLASGWREVHLRVPHTGANYTVELVTETLDSGGVFGTVAVHAGVRTHAEPPTVLRSSVAPTDARVDALTVTVTLSSVGHVHYAALAHGQRFDPREHAGSVGAGVLRGRASIDDASGTTTTGNWTTDVVIEGLRERAAYDVYVRTETLHSDGVLGEWSVVPITARTHGLPAEVLDELECEVAPSCAALGREMCSERPNVCGECLEGHYVSAEDEGHEANAPCHPQPSARAGRGIRISGVRVHSVTAPGSEAHTNGDHYHQQQQQQQQQQCQDVEGSDDALGACVAAAAASTSATTMSAAPGLLERHPMTMMTSQ